LHPALVRPAPRRCGAPPPYGCPPRSAPLTPPTVAAALSGDVSCRRAHRPLLLWRYGRRPLPAPQPPPFTRSPPLSASVVRPVFQNAADLPPGSFHRHHWPSLDCAGVIHSPPCPPPIPQIVRV